MCLRLLIVAALVSGLACSRFGFGRERGGGHGDSGGDAYGLSCSRAEDCDDGIRCTVDLCDLDARTCVHQWTPRPLETEICGDGIDQNCDGVVDGRGDGTFAPEQVTAVGTHPWAMAAGDFNADGLGDLVVALSDDDILSPSGGPTTPLF